MTVGVMDNLIFNSLSKYFNSLSKLGYVPYKRVLNLLILLHLNRLNAEDFSELMSEEDRTLLSQITLKIVNSDCMKSYINE